MSSMPNNVGHAILIGCILWLIVFCEWQGIRIPWYVYIPLVIILIIPLVTWLTVHTDSKKEAMELDVHNKKIEKMNEEIKLLRLKRSVIKLGMDNGRRERRTKR